MEKIKKMEIENIIKEFNYRSYSLSELHMIRRFIRNLKLKKFDLIIDEVIDMYVADTLYNVLERSKYYDKTNY